MKLTNGKSSHWDHGGRRQAVVASILADVFQGRLRTGQHLVTQKLAERFGVSHTPIREALISLAGVGVIDLLPNRGAVVRAVTPRDVRELCQVRRVLECQATRNACGQILQSDLQSLADNLRLLVGPNAPAIAEFIRQARRIDTRLHDLIAGHCGNAFLGKELARLKTLFRAFRDVSYKRHAARNDMGRLADEAREHLEIVENLLSRQPRQAALAMAKHIRSGARYWSRGIAQAQSAHPLNGVVS
jgi:DNA-binding GntR family transcriptional regulator